MATHTPPPDLEPWETLDPAMRATLASQVPARLQRVMYGADHDSPDPADFRTDIAWADARLTELCAHDHIAARRFGTLTFASVAHEPNRQLAAEREYYLCNALIDYANQHHDREFPVLGEIRDPRTTIQRVQAGDSSLDLNPATNQWVERPWPPTQSGGDGSCASSDHPAS
ncbi:hypothetical protein FH609_004180 [Streptomyces sp. 3MP-14]|uniref:Uncharacterized protein n=1 Tax=Streptomyces mimosae TaxID=2586635 RepID=A0A5N6A2K5_9ACTN|nr:MULTISPECIES: hypothetical protein [Streptomyces]KAB8162931.1 hypothetical protein FH607_020040 [Streptomyces mimosae]KAB8179145.1 hypothetical protein FH609_004180 [Streptomyces sp. 3MP-14]